MAVRYIIRVFNDCKSPMAIRLFSGHLRRCALHVFVISFHNFHDKTKNRDSTLAIRFIAIDRSLFNNRPPDLPELSSVDLFPSRKRLREESVLAMCGGNATRAL